MSHLSTCLSVGDGAKRQRETSERDRSHAIIMDVESVTREPESHSRRIVVVVVVVVST